MKTAIRIVLALILLPWSPGVFAQESGRELQLVIPKPYREQMKESGAYLELSLKDAIRLALTHNLEIEIENYNEELNRERIYGTKGFYDPVMTFNLNWNSAEQPNTRVLDAGAGIRTSIFKRWTFNTSFRQTFSPGTRIDASFNNNRNTTNDAFSTINPSFGSNIGFQVTQPLWKGFRETQTERQLKLFNLDTSISDRQFEQRVSEIIQQVENQYWELAYTIENYETRRESLNLAIIQYRNNQKRVEIGVMAPIEITSSRAEVATREQEMISSEVQIINAQNNFKRLLSSDPDEPIWDMNLIPTEIPQYRDITIGLDEAVKKALSRRPELEQIRLEMEKLNVDRKFYKREGKPQIDLVAGIQSIGTAGDTFFICQGRPDDPPECQNGDKIPDPNNPFKGDFRQSWGQIFDFDYMNYSLGVQVTIPLKNRSNEAQLAQISISERQMTSRFKDTQQMILVDVRNAFESLATQRKALEAARVARELSEEQLEGENKRFEAGLSTNFEVLRFQRDLADARVRELRAIVDYQNAVTALQKAMFTIVDDNDIVTAKRTP